MKNEARLCARKAVDVIRRGSLTIMATWNGNLYKRCWKSREDAEKGALAGSRSWGRRCSRPTTISPRISTVGSRSESMAPCMVWPN